jgi:hypothetical protein
VVQGGGAAKLDIETVASAVHTMSVSVAVGRSQQAVDRYFAVQNPFVARGARAELWAGFRYDRKFPQSTET